MKSNFHTLARGFLLAILITISGSLTKLHAQQFLTTIDGWNAYVHLPDDYNDSLSKRYPVIIFLPGIGELGSNPAKLLQNGPSKFIADGHNMQFTVNGTVEKPIVISLQPLDPWAPAASVLNKKIDSIVARWRCDVQRINGTGLSLGASTWGTYVSAGNVNMTNRLASMVVMSGGAPETGVSSIRNYSINGGKWWGFEGTTDPVNLDKVRDTINAYRAAAARYYRYTGGHCCWNTWYNPTWKENDESIYTWMLKQKRPAGNNITPQSDAGRDTAVLGLIPIFNLAGAGNDPDGHPISYNWRKVDGPLGAIITNPNAAQTTVVGLLMGVYKFELSVTDILGAVNRDTITVADGLMLLPLTLLDFKATEKSHQVLLDWSTTSEVNVSHFEIEKMDAARQFVKAGGLPSKSASTTVNSYQFSDNFAEAGYNYYRLKIVDKDGHFTYSETIAVNVKKSAGSELSFMSVQARTNLVLTISSPGAFAGVIVVADMQGRVLNKFNASLSKGINTISQPFTFPRGTYVAKVISSAQSIAQVFIKE